MGAFGQNWLSPTTKARIESVLNAAVVDATQALTLIEPSGEVSEPPQGAHTLVSVTSDEVAPATAYVPAGQVMRPEQRGVERRPTEPKVPAGHCVQRDAPLEEL